MISQRRLCEGQEGRRKEHCLIIWMCNEQAYPLVTQQREPRLGHADGVQPCDDEQDWQRGPGRPVAHDVPAAMAVYDACKACKEGAR